MPTNPTPSTSSPLYRIWVIGPNDVEFQIDLGSQIHTEPNGEEAVQSLVNHLAEWPDLVSISYAHKTVTNIYTITPDAP